MAEIILTILTIIVMMGWIGCAMRWNELKARAAQMDKVEMARMIELGESLVREGHWKTRVTLHRSFLERLKRGAEENGDPAYLTVVWLIDEHLRDTHAAL